MFGRGPAGQAAATGKNKNAAPITTRSGRNDACIVWFVSSSPPARYCRSSPRNAQAYPSKPITIIVPFGPGSATDTITRVVGQHLSARAQPDASWSRTSPGANGAIAALYVARAAPDGYTLFMSTNSPHSAVPFLMKNVAYDPVKDFTAIIADGQLHADAGAASRACRRSRSRS